MLFRLNPDDPGDVSEVRSTTLAEAGWREVHLENLIVENIDRVLRADDLMVVSQEIQFQEEPDIMALDRHGHLYMFELKRWTSSQENLLQILRYGQRFGPCGYDTLEYLWTRYQSKLGGPGTSLEEAHARYFELTDPLDERSFNAKQRYVVITDGLDQGTRNAIGFWSQNGIPVFALPYRVYRTHEGAVFLELRRFGAQGQDFDDVREGCVVVNTNSAYMPDAWREMVREGKASAYYDRKRAVESISAGAYVALYHSGVGFIAIGTARGHFRRASVGDDVDEEYYVPCDWEFTVDVEGAPTQAVPAREINEFLSASHRFRQTVYTLPDTAIDFLRKRLRERRSTSA